MACSPQIFPQHRLVTDIPLFWVKGANSMRQHRGNTYAIFPALDSLTKRTSNRSPLRGCPPRRTNRANVTICADVCTLTCTLLVYPTIRISNHVKKSPISSLRRRGNGICFDNGRHLTGPGLPGKCRSEPLTAFGVVLDLSGIPWDHPPGFGELR